MANLQIKDAQGTVRIYNNVSILKMKDTNNNDVNYKESVGVVVSFIKDTGETYSVMDVANGVSVQAPQEPTKAGYIFRGWSEVSHEFVLENKVSFPHVFNAPTTLYAMWEEKAYSGTAQITGLGSELLTGVLFNVSDDFPTSFDQITDERGNVWIQIPTCYRKILTTVDGQITGKIVSFTKIDDTYIPYSVFVAPNGTILPYVRFGKYCMTSGTVAQSKSGTVQSFNIGAARTLAQALGNGYQLYDWQFRELFNDLAMINQRSVQINLSTILGIEHWINYIWIDGFCHNNADYLICYDPAKYVDSPTESTNGYSKLGYTMPTSNTYIKALGYDSNHPFALFPKTGGGSSATYYPDESYYSAGNHPVYCFVGGTAAGVGLFYFDGRYAWSVAFSCRLCYRPI